MAQPALGELTVTKFTLSHAIEELLGFIGYTPMGAASCSGYQSVQFLTAKTTAGEYST